MVLEQGGKDKGKAVRRSVWGVDSDPLVLVGGDNSRDHSNLPMAIDRFHRWGFNLLPCDRCSTASS